MLTRFQAFPSLHQNFPQLFTLLEQLFPIEQKLAIGLSGGSDSMFLSAVLASFWQEKQWNPDQLFFLHCNHQIREESKAEAEFLQAFFQDWQLKIFTREESWIASEESLRNWRYACFREFCEKRGISLLSLGHHLNDKIETSMMNLIRGCWLQGFLNMQVQSSHALVPQMQVLRPLLRLSKQEIEQACLALELPFVEDQSNFESETSLRNKLRNEILQPLSQLGNQKSGKSSFFESRKLIYQQLEAQKQEDWSKRLSPLRKSPYRNAEQAFERTLPRTLISSMSLYGLFQLLEIDAKKNELASIVDRLQKGSNGFRELGKWTIFLVHQQIFLIKGKARFREKELQLEKTITQSGIQTFGAFQLETPEFLIGARLRFPKAGDHYQGKLLSKWALNHKIPVFRRNALPLAEKEGKLILVFSPQQLIF